MIDLQSLRTALRSIFLEGFAGLGRGTWKSESYPSTKYFEFVRIFIIIQKIRETIKII